MNDRELLEAAARAAGNGPLDFDSAEHERHGFYLGPRLPMTKGVLMAAMWTNWNPLEDDGDALRLAVRFDLLDEHAGFLYTLHVELGRQPDRLAAARRAIVLTVAEIGSKL
jgi:hypothetical protein